MSFRVPIYREEIYPAPECVHVEQTDVELIASLDPSVTFRYIWNDIEGSYNS